MNTIRSVSFKNCRLFPAGMVLSSIVVFFLLFATVLAVSCSSTGGDVSAQLQAIRNLHHSYGYYIDKCLYEDVVDLFAEDGEVRFVGGIYKGRDAGVRRLYVGGFLQGFTGGVPGPVYGFLLDHLQMQDVIHVAEDRKTAKARFRAFMQAGMHETHGT